MVYWPVKSKVVEVARSVETELNFSPASWTFGVWSSICRHIEEKTPLLQLFQGSFIFLSPFSHYHVYIPQ